MNTCKYNDHKKHPFGTKEFEFLLNTSKYYSLQYKSYNFTVQTPKFYT